MFQSWDFDITSAPQNWARACTHDECTLHQISPYIGKVKSVIAHDLLERYSRPGDLVADPFCGSGTIPLEALLMGRKAFASDVSAYAGVLTQAKLNAPQTLEEAQERLRKSLLKLAKLPGKNLAAPPVWVRDFFHAKTLREVRLFASVLKSSNDDFLLACLLGILHHQRPGFLSFPSSHLVPYLRDKKFPRSQFPELYKYRDLRPRMEAKLLRVYKKVPTSQMGSTHKFISSSVEHVRLPSQCHCIATSPPYMNALDYGRDNRLRLWLLGEREPERIDNINSVGRKAFYEQSMRSFLDKAWSALVPKGYLILVVGETTRRSGSGHPFEIIDSMIRVHFPRLRRHEVIQDIIPDIRRSRRDCRGVKREMIAVYRKQA